MGQKREKVYLIFLFRRSLNWLFFKKNDWFEFSWKKLRRNYVIKIRFLFQLIWCMYDQSSLHPIDKKYRNGTALLVRIIPSLGCSEGFWAPCSLVLAQLVVEEFSESFRSGKNALPFQGQKILMAGFRRKPTSINGSLSSRWTYAPHVILIVHSSAAYSWLTCF